MSPPVGYLRIISLNLLNHPKISLSPSYFLKMSLNPLKKNPFLGTRNSTISYLLQIKSRGQQETTVNMFIVLLMAEVTCAHKRTDERVGYIEATESTRTWLVK